MQLKYIDDVVFAQAAICKSEYPWYADFISRNQIKKIIEFGPGSSTWAFLENPGLEIISYEPHPKWYETALETFKDFPNVTIRHFDEFIVEEADFVHVDSPPAAGDFPRLESCQRAMQCSTLFIMHDAKRQGERNTSKCITEEDGWVCELVMSNRGIAIFNKNREYDYNRDMFKR
ncbi:MAG: hypothetical protein HRT89_18925 [Lentisphaeria bacterium]|nr:hypothetical protein [Lentisphaeria bacterium]